MIGAPFVLYFALLTLGYYPEPQSHVALEDRSPGERIAIMHLWIALFSAASMFSCVGSLVSHLSRLNSADVDVENESFLLSLHVLGTIFGIVILLLFLGGFVQGELFPDFRGAGFLSLHTQFSSVDGWAKLLIWTFVAGFSERLVPDLLMNISRKLPDSTVDENSA